MNPLGQYDLEMRALIDLGLAGPGLVRELFYPGGFAIFTSKVIKLRTANFPPSLHLNTFDVWREEKEGAFHTDFRNYSSDCERTRWASPSSADHVTLERLDSFSASLANSNVHSDGVTRLEIGDSWVGFQLYYFTCFHNGEQTPDYSISMNSIDHAAYYLQRSKEFRNRGSLGERSSL